MLELLFRKIYTWALFGAPVVLFGGSSPFLSQSIGTQSSPGGVAVWKDRYSRLTGFDAFLIDRMVYYKFRAIL